MGPRDLLKAALLAAGLLAAANVAVARLSWNSAPRQALRRVASVPAADVVAVGNSVVQSGFDPAAFAGAAPGHEAVNAALGGTGPVQHLLLLRAALRAHPGARTVVYGVLDLLPVEDDARPLRWTSETGANALIFQSEPAVAAPYVDTTAAGRWLFRAAGFFPMYVERGTPWSKVEILRRAVGGTGLPAAATNEFGRVEDFRALVAGDDAGGWGAAYGAASRAPLAPAVRAVLEASRARGARTVMVMMPVPPERLPSRARPEWRAYLAHLRGLAAADGAEFVDAGDWVPDASKFEDVMHLNAEGARVFSARLARELAAAR